MSDLKMYFLIKDYIDIGHALNSMGHAGAMIDREWPKCNVSTDPDYNELMNEWWEESFRKCTCRVTEEQFEKAKTYGDYFAVTEMAFDEDEVILVMKPRREWPRFFSFLPLYK